MLRPAADWELASILSEASATGMPVDIAGGHTKAQFGRPPTEATPVSTHVMRGIQSYDPVARIVVAQAGCRMSDLERELAARGQMLPFEPIDMATVFGDEPGRATIGGVIASNLPGSRRIVSGGIADALLGLKAVAGTGEIFRCGGSLTRGASGINLTRVIAGSWGTLAAVVEVALRVEPIPAETRTLVMFGLSEEIAIEALSSSLATPDGVTGTVHLEAPMAARLWSSDLAAERQPVTAIRLEGGSGAGLDHQLSRLRAALHAYGDMYVLDNEKSLSFWHEMRMLSVLPLSDTPLWRISTVPSKAFELVSGIRRYMQVDAVYDWSGGLIWLEVPPSADAGATEIRRMIAATGGHATLVRAPDAVKQSVDVFEPMHRANEQMTKRLKQVFDPAHILNRGRIYADM